MATASVPSRQPPPADHDAHAKAEEHAAKTNREQGLAGGVRPAVEELDARGERCHREDGARGKAAAELDASQDDEGRVQNNREQGEGNARYVREHHAHADDAAVQDGVGNEELLHDECGDGGAEGEERVVNDGDGRDVDPYGVPFCAVRHGRSGCGVSLPKELGATRRRRGWRSPSRDRRNRLRPPSPRRRRGRPSRCRRWG